MEQYVFISYSHQDQRIVRNFADRLEQRGYSVWYDQAIQPGTLWDDTIKERLRNAAIVLMFISPSFIKSEYCRLELQLALEQKKSILPVYLGRARFEPALQEQLDRIQNIDLADGSLDECLQRVQKHDLIRKCQGKFYSTKPGPDRDFYENSAPVDHITFNSVKDHPVYGDERRFLRTKLPGRDAFRPVASVKLQPDQIYEFELLIHNNAASGIAKSTRIAVHMPEFVRPSRCSEILAVLSSVNASPVQIWDAVELHTEKLVFLEFVDASAVYHCGGQCDGQLISSSFIKTDHGFYVGFDQFDGNVPAGEEHLCQVTFKVRAYEENGGIGYTKKLLKENDLPEGHVRLGEVFTVQTEFRNMGSFSYRNVGFTDTFPEGMELIPGTTVLRNGANPNGLKMKDIIHKNGFNTGLYGPHANAILTYQARFVSGSGKRWIGGCVAHDSGMTNSYLPVFVEE